ncbi:MAG: class I SAM-dependent methyltransferase [archaeon]
MNKKQKEQRVKELYEKYPYPSRLINKANEIIYFAEWVARIFGETKEYWKGKTVLELGCGTGELANALALCGASVTAIDFSSSSIKKAKELSKKLKTSKKIQFVLKNILELNEDSFVKKSGTNTQNKNTQNKKFDVVIALGSLHHTTNALKGFQIGCKFAKPNGLVIIGLYNKYARLRHRIRRSFLRAIAGNNIEKRILVGEKLFGAKESEGKAWAADKYGQVHESYHTVGQVLHWFRDEGIEFMASKPEFEKPLIDEIKWLFEKKGAFFVMTGKKQ